MHVSYPLTVFYDGACGVCSREMTHYRSIADQRLLFVDISAADFDAASYGKSAAEFQAMLHVRDGEGRYFTGVEAFRRLWESLPSPFYPLLSGLVGLPGIHFAARTGYALFARFRHLLPASHAASCPVSGDRKTR